MHPGWAATKGVREWLALFRALTLPFIRTPEQGADTIVWLGSAPRAIQTTGQLWHDRRVRPFTHRPGAGPDGDRAASELWDYVSALAGRPESQP